LLFSCTYLYSSCIFSPYPYLIYKFTTSVRDGARVHHRQPTEPDANRRVEFLVPSLWAKLLEEIKLGHSSTERRPRIADVKNRVCHRRPTRLPDFDCLWRGRGGAQHAPLGKGGPARGEKLIIYNRGTGGDQRVKESEWKMRRRGGSTGWRTGVGNGKDGARESTGALCTGYPLVYIYAIFFTPEIAIRTSETSGH
jgi:hypothetical protein